MLYPIDHAMAFFAALDALRAGGDAGAAIKAAGDSIHPCGILNWQERPTALRCAAQAVEQHMAEEVANGRPRADDMMKLVCAELDRRERKEAAE